MGWSSPDASLTLVFLCDGGACNVQNAGGDGALSPSVIMLIGLLLHVALEVLPHIVARGVDQRLHHVDVDGSVFACHASDGDRVAKVQRRNGFQNGSVSGLLLVIGGVDVHFSLHLFQVMGG